MTARSAPGDVRNGRSRPVLLLWSGLSLLAVAGCGQATEDGGQAAPPARVFHLASGPLSEIRITPTTDGRFVVSGFCYFPDDTRLTIAIYDSLGHAVGQTRPVVENGQFLSLPVGPVADGDPVPRHREIGISAGFSPGEQTATVLEETRTGLALEGEGMFTTERGYAAFALRFPVQP